MRQLLRPMLLAVLIAVAPACTGPFFVANGGLYSHTVEPLTFNKRPTGALGDLRTSSGDIQHIQIRASVMWGSNGIGDIARKNGMGTVYFADREQRSIFFGLWQEEIVHIYGR